MTREIKESIEWLETARNKKPEDFIEDGTLYDGWKRYCGYLHSVIFQALALLRKAQEQPPAGEFTKKFHDRSEAIRKELLEALEEASSDFYYIHQHPEDAHTDAYNFMEKLKKAKR